MTMTDKPDDKPWGWAKWTGTAVALLMLYPLSAGPSFRLVITIGGPNYPTRLALNCLFIFYAPLVWAGQACKPFHDISIWYIRLWGVT
jgi:hypothetical protein